jgi:23S rRNA (cytosine1962-C5)-methyltransferase
VVVEDALSFARRAARRGERFEGILLDPPHHGKGPRGERWQFEEHAAELVEQAGALLAPDGFLVLSTYAFGTSPLALEGLLFGLSGELAVGELALREEEGGRLLPCGSCARLVRGRYAR